MPVDVAWVPEIETETAFSVEQAFRGGALGESVDFVVTTSGVEAIACCHSVIAGG